MKLKGQRKTMKHCAFCGICIDICLNSVKKNYSNTGMPITQVLVISNAVLHFDIYWWIFTRMCTLDIILIMNKKISGDWHVSNCAIKIISHHCLLKTLTIANIISSCKIIGFTLELCDDCGTILPSLPKAWIRCNHFSATAVTRETKQVHIYHTIVRRFIIYVILSITNLNLKSVLDIRIVFVDCKNFMEILRNQWEIIYFLVQKQKQCKIRLEIDKKGNIHPWIVPKDMFHRHYHQPCGTILDTQFKNCDYPLIRI